MLNADKNGSSVFTHSVLLVKIRRSGETACTLNRPARKNKRKHTLCMLPFPIYNLSRYPDLNRGPTHYECVALPTELYRLKNGAKLKFSIQLEKVFTTFFFAFTAKSGARLTQSSEPDTNISINVAARLYFYPNVRELFLRHDACGSFCRFSANVHGHYPSWHLLHHD